MAAKINQQGLSCSRSETVNFREPKGNTVKYMYTRIIIFRLRCNVENIFFIFGDARQSTQMHLDIGSVSLASKSIVSGDLLKGQILHECKHTHTHRERERERGDVGSQIPSRQGPSGSQRDGSCTNFTAPVLN